MSYSVAFKDSFKRSCLLLFLCVFFYLAVIKDNQQRQNFCIYSLNDRSTHAVPHSRINTHLQIYRTRLSKLEVKQQAKKNVRACNDFEYFGLIGDEATDVSTHEQASVCVRFVECTGGKVILHEEFLGFVSASETTDENLAELF